VRGDVYHQTLLQAQDHVDGQQRIPTQEKKIVVNTDRFIAEKIRPD
jgi:hypothetical protein